MDTFNRKEASDHNGSDEDAEEDCGEDVEDTVVSDPSGSGLGGISGKGGSADTNEYSPSNEADQDADEKELPNDDQLFDNDEFPEDVELPRHEPDKTQFHVPDDGSNPG